MVDGEGYETLLGWTMGVSGGIGCTSPCEAVPSCSNFYVLTKSLFKFSKPKKNKKNY